MARKGQVIPAPKPGKKLPTKPAKPGKNPAADPRVGAGKLFPGSF